MMKKLYFIKHIGLGLACLALSTFFLTGCLGSALSIADTIVNWGEPAESIEKEETAHEKEDREAYERYDQLLKKGEADSKRREDERRQMMEELRKKPPL